MPLLCLIQASNYALPVIVIVASVLTLSTGLAVFFVTRSIFRSTLPTQEATQWRRNYEAEKISREFQEKRANEFEGKFKILEAEHNTLALDFSQVSQLYAKKSIILESITGHYQNLAGLAESGELQQYLASIHSPVKPTRIGETSELNPDSPHVTKS